MDLEKELKGLRMLKVDHRKELISLGRQISHRASYRPQTRTEYGIWHDLVAMYEKLYVLLRAMANENEQVRNRIIANSKREWRGETEEYKRKFIEEFNEWID